MPDLGTLCFTVRTCDWFNSLCNQVRLHSTLLAKTCCSDYYARAVWLGCAPGLPQPLENCRFGRLPRQRTTLPRVHSAA